MELGSQKTEGWSEQVASQKLDSPRRVPKNHIPWSNKSRSPQGAFGNPRNVWKIRGKKGTEQKLIPVIVPPYIHVVL